MSKRTLVRPPKNADRANRLNQDNAVKDQIPQAKDATEARRG